ncbi:hypothetical protein [Bradyrhizobium elkanii]|uniref:Uncharacterized protein n=1 Tax=Bradyrhizobium elkanii TaxID=29448 RepID=A0A8I2C453_BRAEL|nr:hypothetical protein [Bradyrhizobium elkanii]MBP1294309.1 hypothetical protein [Bradyrhizobium elkanii]
MIRKRSDYRDPAAVKAAADRAAGIAPAGPIWQMLGYATEREYDAWMNDFTEAMYQGFEKDDRLAAMPAAGNA